MTTEAQPPAEAGVKVVSLAVFEAVNCEAPLADTRSIYGATLASLYEKAAKAAGQEGREHESRVYGLLSALTRMHFKPHDRAEPYGPLLVMEGRRSIIPDDLRGEQSAVFAAIAPTLKNAGLRALLADIAWLNDRSRAASAQLAIGSFCEAVRLVSEGKAELFFR